MERKVQLYQHFAEECFCKTAPGGAVLVGREGKVEWSQGFGLADVEAEKAIGADTRFLIGSVSKQFTAMSILMLAEKGKLGLEDPITRFFPSFPAYGENIALRHLLTHTSGIKEYLVDDFWNDPEHRHRNIDLSEIVQMIHSYSSPDFQAGSDFSYCNSGYVLLGEIIAKVSGQSFKDYVTNNLLIPAGMDQTLVGSCPSQQISNLAKGYRESADGHMQLAPYTMATIGWADGNLVSTVGDLYKWQQFIQLQPPVGPAWLNEWFTPFTLNDGTNTGYAMGWFIHNRRGVPETWHSGGTQGYTARYSRFPDQNAAIIILTNYETSPRDYLTGKLARILLADELQPLAGVNPNAHNRLRISGLYQNQKKELEMLIEEHDNQLLAKSKLWEEAGAIPVRQISADCYRLDSPHEFYLIETQNPAGETFMTLDVNGRHIRMCKE